MYYFLFLVFAIIGLYIMLFSKKMAKKKRITVGGALVIIAICFMVAGIHHNDWSAGSSNWNNVSNVNDHVTENDSDITSVKKYHGYMLITLKGGTIDFGDTKSANTADTFDQCFDYAKDAKSGVASKGVLIYQKSQHGDMSNFAVFYSKKDFKHIPSQDAMLDDRSVVLKKSTAYSLGAANYNSTGLAKKGVKLESSHQPKWFNDFADNHYLGN